MREHGGTAPMVYWALMGHRTLAPSRLSELQPLQLGVSGEIRPLQIVFIEFLLYSVHSFTSGRSPEICAMRLAW